MGETRISHQLVLEPLEQPALPLQGQQPDVLPLVHQFLGTWVPDLGFSMVSTP
ncbi:unnamed protein product, partial [Ixodes persulcatus]